MKKLIIGIGVLIVILIAVAIVAFLSLNGIVRGAVETVGSKATQTEVTLQQVQLSPLSGNGAISELAVGNPEGFNSDYAFQLGSVNVSLVPKSVLSDKVRIREIVIDAPVITFEQRLTGNNIAKIRSNVNEFAGKKEKKEEEKPAPEKPGKQVTIDHLVIKNGQINLRSGITGKKGIDIALPAIELNDIGKGDKGMTAPEAVNKVIEVVTAAVVQAVSQSGELSEKGLKLLREGTGDLGKAVEGIGQEAGKQAKEAIEKMGEQGGSLLDKLPGK